MIELLNFRCVFERFILFLPAVKNLTLLDTLQSINDKMQTSRESLFSLFWVYLFGDLRVTKFFRVLP